MSKYNNKLVIDLFKQRDELKRENEALKQRIKRLEKAVDAYRKAYTPDGHVAPHDCFATGPKTGNLWQDYLTCPLSYVSRLLGRAKSQGGQAVSGSRVRRIMADGIDAPKLPKGAIVEMVKQAQKIRVNDGPTAFSRRKQKGTK